MSIAGEHLTGAEMAAVLSKVLGERVAYVPVPFDVLRAQEWPGAEEAANMFQFYVEVPEFVDVRDLDAVRSLNPALQTFEQWAQEHKTRSRAPDELRLHMSCCPAGVRTLRGGECSRMPKWTVRP